MSSILPFASRPHAVWSPMANEIHAAIWDCGLEKVQGIVQEWASDRVAQFNAAEATRQEKFARVRQALHYPADWTLGLIADNLPDDRELREAIWEPVLSELPLPPSHRSRSPAEKWAALSAVHDVFDLSGDKVLPAPLPEDDQELVAFTEWMQGEGGAYQELMRAASALTDSEADPVRRWLVDVQKGGAPEGGGVIWQDAAQRLERLRAGGEPFTSQHDFAKRFCCSPATVNRAIRDTPSLHPWAKPETTTAPKALSINPLVTDNTAQQCEADPSDIITDDEAQATLRRLIEQAPEEKRPELHNLAKLPPNELRRCMKPYADADDLGNRVLGRRP